MRMRFTDYGVMAFRNLINQQSRSVLAILAILIGTASVIIMLALVMGAKDFYYEQFKVTGKLQQVIVNPQTGLDFERAQQASNCENCVKLTDNMANKIISLNHVTSLSRTADVNIFEAAALGRQRQMASGAQGYDPNGIIKHVFVAGRDFSDSDGTGKVIIGQGYADQWGYKNNYAALIGKQINLTTSSSFTGEGAVLPDPLLQFKQCQKGCQPDQVAQQQPSTLKATIVGVESDVGNGLFVPLRWADKLLQSRRYEITKADQEAYTQTYNAWKDKGQRGPEPTPHFTLVSDSQFARDGYSTFVVKADTADNTEAVAGEIQKLGVGATTAGNYVKEQTGVFNIISFIMAGIGSIALMVAAIGVVNTMVMATLERTREIGVMRAVGARRSTVSRLFTLEASLLGFFGGTAGIALGFGLVQLANIFINAQLAANAIIGRNIISLPGWLILIVIVVTTTIGMLAGLYPAHRAARLDPVEALRHD